MTLSLDFIEKKALRAKELKATSVVICERQLASTFVLEIITSNLK